MKYFLIFCLVLLSTLGSSAQKDFEGVIKYKVTSPEGSEGERDKTNSMHITLFLAPGKLLMKNDKAGGDEEEDVLVLIDSAKVYTINHMDKTYRVKRLRESKAITPAVKENIAGYMGIPVQFGGNKLAGMLGGNTTLWFAEELIFSIPKKYEGNEELIMINNNHILLKAIIQTDFQFNYGMDDEDAPIDEKLMEATLIATEIISTPQNPSVFSIPFDYKKENNLSYSPSMSDTTLVMMDTMPVMDTMPPPPKKDATKKSPVKQPAKTTPAKKPIRKEN